jgi:hypothetical protein
MSLKVSKLSGTPIRPYRVAFFLIASDSYENEVRAELERQASAFAEDMGGQGVFVQPFPSRRRDVADEALAKPWPPEIHRQLQAESEPIILVIESDFDDFDPREDRWAIIWLSHFEEGGRDVQPMLKTLSTATRRGEDIIGYLNSVADREEERGTGGRLVRFAVRAGSYVQWEPKIPFIGLGIDVRSVLRDLASS